MADQKHPMKIPRLTYFPTRKTNQELEDKILNYYVEEDLLSAADLQLEQVKEWLRNNLNFWYLKPTEVGHSCHEIDVDKVVEDLQKAMRPAETQEAK
jgi:hypothetical protein